MQIIVDDMRWERIILKIHGHVDMADNETDCSDLVFLLYDHNTRKSVRLKYISFDSDNNFLLRADLFRANELFPMPNGIWSLFAVNKAGKKDKKSSISDFIPVKVDKEACGFNEEAFVPFNYGDSYYPYYRWTDRYKDRISKIFRYRRYEYIINISESSDNADTLTFDIFYDGKGYMSDAQYDKHVEKSAERKNAIIDDAKIVWEQFKIDNPELFESDDMEEEQEERSFVSEAFGFTKRIYKKIKKKYNHALTFVKTHVYKAFFYIFSRTVHKNGKTILFTSDSRDSLSGNMECIYNRLIERGLDKEYDIKQIFKANVRDRRKFRDKFRFTYDIVKADYIILDDYHPLLYKVDFPPSTTLIQVWHASGAFKTVGYSRIGKPGGPSPFARQHKNYTYALVSSEYDVPFYAEAYGIEESHVVPTGIPRMDFFFNEDYKAETKERMHREFPSTVGKNVVMFAPTFRGTGPRTAFYDVEMIDYAALAQYCKDTDSIIIFKMHPFVIEPLEIPEEFSEYFIDATDYREINDILFIADLVITDYSSLIFEYSTLGKPMIFYAYDLQKYISKRDFYFEFEPFVPGKIVMTSEELIRALYEKDYEIEKVEKFRNEHFKYFDDGSTDRVIDDLILKNKKK